MTDHSVAEDFFWPPFVAMQAFLFNEDHGFDALIGMRVLLPPTALPILSLLSPDLNFFVIHMQEKHYVSDLMLTWSTVTNSAGIWTPHVYILL